MKKYIVKLSREERERLQDLISKGKGAAVSVQENPGSGNPQERSGKLE